MLNIGSIVFMQFIFYGKREKTLYIARVSQSADSIGMISHIKPIT